MKKKWRFVYQNNQFWGECLPCTLAVFLTIIDPAVVDDSCIDASRISYAPRREDIYFIDEKNLF